MMGDGKTCLNMHKGTILMETKKAKEVIHNILVSKLQKFFLSFGQLI